MMNSARKRIVTAYLVRINQLYDGSYDWNHRDTRRTSAPLKNCDKPAVAFQKMLDGEQALIAHSDIVAIEKLIKEYQELGT